MRAQFVRHNENPLDTLKIGKSRFKELLEPVEKIINPILQEYKFDSKEKKEIIDEDHEMYGISFMGTMKEASLFQKKIINSPCEYFVAIRSNSYIMGYQLGDGKWISNLTDSPKICLDQIKAWIKKGSSGKAF
jgi:hypothetical protein